LSAIEFDGVWYSYRDGGYALSDVTFSVKAGEAVAIVGHNGSGKTTLLRHLNGLVKPTRGTVTILGMDTKGISVSRLSRSVGLVFQNPRNQLFAQTALEEAAFGPRNFKLKDPVEAARSALSEMRLAGHESRSPLSLSGGEQKRLSIAAVLSWSPRILALDEPTVGQGLHDKMRLLGLIRLWSSRGITVVIASHDVEFIWRLNPRVIAMSGGSIVADGPAHDVLSDEEAARSAGFRPPQLAEIGNALGLREIPGDIEEAADALMHLMRGVRR
jgi:energy-coupling factor transport system ATP-binding protein